MSEHALDHRVSSDARQVRKVAVASSFGTGIELYDFLIFGLAAGLVFPKLFFPQSDPLVGVLLSFLTFGVGFVPRPLGGLVFGHFGDRVSRRLMLVICLVATGICTVAMGLLPTYQTVGPVAPVLLVALRTLQGFFMGGEQSGAFLMVTEHAPVGKKAFFGAAATAGSPMGSVLGILAFQITAAATGPAFTDWGWRIPFLASAILIILGVYVRLGLEESPVFTELKQEVKATPRVPLGAAFAKAGPMMIAGVLVNLGFNLFVFVIITFTNAYGTTVLKMDRNVFLMAGLFASLGQLVFCFVAAKLADRVGLNKVMLGGAIFQVLWAFPYFLLLNTKQPGMVYLAMIVGMSGLAFIFGPMAAYYSSLFAPSHRYSGVALSYNLGAVLGGGLSSFIATALLRQFGSSTPISLYVMLGGLLSALGIFISLKRVHSHFPRLTNPDQDHATLR
ncbi:MFS transporter [Enemella dayhoffiae]|uniref:MFS transporter n=1 Tax=Enemella dayhoffiae TaxID=2016507 RepID=A0A255GZB9_9ACTN|nr:MFS transporter [Enemella dayhoffiae]OYO20961.1 MFS transporter [Enemella dayhoffiae]